MNPTVTFNEALWFAIAEPSRRRLLDILLAQGESSASKLAKYVPFSRQAVAKHLVILKKAGLVFARRDGKEMRFAVQPQAMTAATQELSKAALLWDSRLHALKQVAEAIHEADQELYNNSH